MAFLDELGARLEALLQGTYPATSTAPNRQIPPGTFVAGTLSLPRENAEFPSDVIVERTFDRRWRALGYDGPDPGLANAYQGPHTSIVRATLRVQYKVTTPDDLVPRDGRGLDLGALDAPTQRALSDVALLRWCLLYPPSWDGLTPTVITCAFDGEAVTEQLDSLRVAAVVPLRWLISASAVTSPGVAT